MQLAHSTPALKIGRHVVGMALFALLNPLIYYDPSPAFLWASGWLTPLVISGVLYGLYALFFTSRVKSTTPLFVLAWGMVMLMALGGWGEYNSTSNHQSHSQQDQLWLDKGSTIIKE